MSSSRRSIKISYVALQKSVNYQGEAPPELVTDEYEFEYKLLRYLEGVQSV